MAAQSVTLGLGSGGGAHLGREAGRPWCLCGHVPPGGVQAHGSVPRRVPGGGSWAGAQGVACESALPGGQ